jgi:hypothetical protein
MLVDLLEMETMLKEGNGRFVGEVEEGEGDVGTDDLSKDVAVMSSVRY